MPRDVIPIGPALDSAREYTSHVTLEAWWNSGALTPFRGFSFVGRKTYGFLYWVLSVFQYFLMWYWGDSFVCHLSSASYIWLTSRAWSLEVLIPLSPLCGEFIPHMCIIVLSQMCHLPLHTFLVYDNFDMRPTSNSSSFSPAVRSRGPCRTLIY